MFYSSLCFIFHLYLAWWTPIRQLNCWFLGYIKTVLFHETLECLFQVATWCPKRWTLPRLWDEDPSAWRSDSQHRPCQIRALKTTFESKKAHIFRVYAILIGDGVSPIFFNAQIMFNPNVSIFFLRFNSKFHISLLIHPFIPMFVETGGTSRKQKPGSRRPRRPRCIWCT